ncbi:unnamed protein product [Arctia plantaginis]|uniref:Uncharacterized protein n=1 Tax=Arctia plantaginis TaxID=874455 RepID=A0A8S0Z943_ARCPL|nr:unnamed protein product [Arctia plantaginis]
MRKGAEALTWPPLPLGAGASQLATRPLNQDNYQLRNKTQQASNGQNTRSEKDLINEITKLINKFALSTNIEPDSYLSKNEIQKDPSIAIYFKGPYSCLIVILGDKQWHYVPQTPPFPAWFYESHNTFEAPLKIPEHTRYAFLQVLLRLLKLILSHPL